MGCSSSKGSYKLIIFLDGNFVLNSNEVALTHFGNIAIHLPLVMANKIRGLRPRQARLSQERYSIYQLPLGWSKESPFGYQALRPRVVLGDVEASPAS
jgi:hypothetical protein